MKEHGECARAGRAGAAVTLAELEDDPHPALARLRERAPVSRVPALGGWLVTRYDLAVACLRDSRSFTVDDPRFSTARVTGPSMLSLDGAAHARHRSPFDRAFRRAGGSHAGAGTWLRTFTEAEAERLVAAIAPRGRAELRGAVAGPLAVAVIAGALGLGSADPGLILGWYRAIAGTVTGLSGAPGGESPRKGAGPGTAASGGAVPAGTGAPAGAAGQRAGAAGAAAFASLAARLREAITAGDAPGPSLLAGAASSGRLSVDEVVANAAVIMFGGIETTEGMITNAMLHLLRSPGQLALARADPGLVGAAVEESLRLEPAAAFVDRYATGDTDLGGTTVPRGARVSVSLAAANRDPAIFPRPDRFDIRRPNAGRHLAFAHGPHFCLGADLARLETRTAVRVLLDRLPGLRLDPRRPAAPRGLVFRKPPALHVLWEPR